MLVNIHLQTDLGRSLPFYRSQNWSRLLVKEAPTDLKPRSSWSCSKFCSSSNRDLQHCHGRSGMQQDLLTKVGTSCLNHHVLRKLSTSSTYHQQTNKIPFPVPPEESAAEVNNAAINLTSQGYPSYKIPTKYRYAAQKKTFFPRIDKFYQMPQPWINICVSQNLLFCFSSNCYREKIRRNSKYFNALGINAVLQQRWGSCQNLIRNIIFNAYWLFYLKMQTLFFHFWIKTKPIVIHSNRSETRQSGHQYLMVNCWRWADEQLNQLLSIMSSILSPGKCLSRYHLKKNNLESTQVLCFRALASQFAEIQEMRWRATLDCFGPQSKEIHQWVSLDLQ